MIKKKSRNGLLDINEDIFNFICYGVTVYIHILYSGGVNFANVHVYTICVCSSM